MIQKKILVIATYPIANPQHGGQKRTKALLDTYSSIFSEVKFVSIFHKKYVSDYSEEDISIQDPGLIEKIESAPYNGDILTAENLSQDSYVTEKVLSVLQEFKPDLIEIEQVFPYIGIEKIIKEAGINPKIILSSHNIEYRLKRDILKSLGKLDEEARKSIGRLKRAEESLAEKADLVIAVSQSDKKVLEEMSTRKVVLAPNGIERITPTEEAVEHWRKFKSDNNVKSSVLFVGSAHPPNLHGFVNLVGTDLSFLPEESAIMLAGGISTYLEQEYPKTDPSNKKFWSRAHVLGRLSDDNLAGIIQESEVIILPIQEGGGSNLKTAEAILSGKKVVATKHAFRSFDKYLGLPNLYIAKKDHEFKELITKSLDTPYVDRTSKEVKLAENVQWKYCLKQLSHAVGITAVGSFKFYVINILGLSKKVLSRFKRFIR